MSEALPLEGADRARARFGASALLVGERIDVRGVESGRVLASTPLTIATGLRGAAVLFRYGVVVLFEVADDERSAFLTSLGPSVTGAFPRPEGDEAVICVDPGAEEGPDANGVLVLREPSLERFQVVAHVLARSAVLAHYEAELEGALARLEPLADRLRTRGRSGLGGRALLRQLGEVLATQLRMLGRAQVGEKPEMTWERPDLDRLYVRLAAEYELAERERALTRKLELLAGTAGTFLEMLQSRRTLRVEWYIVGLIAVEIVILVYDLFWR